MKPAEIGKAYNSITHLWERDGFNRSNGIEQHKRAITFVNRIGDALDVGCGCTGRIIDLLIDKGFVVEGVDISSEMLKLAQEKHPEVLFHHQDICEFELSKEYDFITAWDSIWHVPLDQQKNVLKKLFSALSRGGVCISSCGGTDDSGDKKDNAMGPDMYYFSLGIPGFLKVISESSCICRHLEYDQYPELHT